MENPNDIQDEFRRLLILQLLEQDFDCTINDEILGRLLKSQGQGVAPSVLLADLAWLERLALISTSDLPGMKLAVLRKEGQAVAQGLSHIPGIARPRLV